MIHSVDHNLSGLVEKAHIFVEALEDVSKTCMVFFLALLAARIIGQFLGVW